MNQMMRAQQGKNFQSTTVAGLLLVGALLAGCQEKPSGAQAPAAAPSPQAAAPAPAPVAVASPAPSQAAEPVAAPAPAQAASKRVPLAVQGVASAGVTVRVKGIEIGSDATVLDVSISFANRITDSTMLALADTFLIDESGSRLHIQRPNNNRDMTIREGETLDGKLVFMGSVPANAKKLQLVFNEGNAGDNIVAPGLSIELPLQGG